ncbi:MAG: hypothetical protein PWQ67_19 [Clostridia bacterium]|jgi:glycosyltransferase involved in cell wall biosynthesis|nr:hypothetical protein [Clostridia bacterium]MDN5321565.1 hypothetical protein [Clostridia bacterium]
MISIVIPVKNEEESISKTLDNCSDLPANYIITVLNGCTDASKKIIENHPLKTKIHLIEFSQPLGIDVPRAIGAAYAYKLNSQVVLFLDGDMQGKIATHLYELITAVYQENTDMALTNCYPYISIRSTMASTVLNYREKLNRRLGVFADLGLASPSHGPHAVSRILLEKVPWRFLAIPPLSLAMAVINNLNIKVATSLPHSLLFSQARNETHSTLIAETIIGDCLEALNYLEGLPPLREEKGIHYLGYHPERKFDVLDKYVESLGIGKIVE